METLVIRSPKSRSILILIGAFSIIILGALTYLSIWITDVKKPLIATFKEYIHGDIKIRKATLVFFPLGIDFKEIELIAPGESKPSASIRMAKLRLALIPLVQKKIETKLIILDPVVYLHQPRKGKNNLEKIFAPLMAEEKKEAQDSLDKFWWKRVAVNKLEIKNAYFKATRAGSHEVMELKNLDVEADRIRFDTKQRPAKIKLSYDLPRISKVPMELTTRLKFDEKKQSLELQKGKFTWGPVEIQLGGKALLPTRKRKEVQLDFIFESQKLSLNKFAKILKDPPPVSGDLSLKGTVKGTAFSPILTLILDSPKLKAKNYTLQRFHAELSKRDKPIKIKTATFDIFGGHVGLTGTVLREEETSADVKISMKSLSVAALSGKKGNPSRLSGNLHLKTPRVENPNAYSGGGTITVGPIPIPVKNLRDKIQVAEILSAATGMSNMVNIGLLSSSANVVGTRIEKVHAKVTIANGNVSLRPFSMGNGHFSAKGNANIIQQKSIEGSGTFTLRPNVTRQLITDPLLRRTLTRGNGQLSVPFAMNGPLADPKITVDNTYLKSQMAKATVVVLQKQALGAVQPQEMLNSALKGTPLGDPNHPVGQILGISTTQQNKTRTQSSSQNSPRKRKPSQSKPLLDQLLFGQ